MAKAFPQPRTGGFLISEIGHEWHVLFQPDDLPHHFLSVARFQNEERARTYAEVEGMVIGDGCGQHDDVLGVAEVVDPKPKRANPVEAADVLAVDRAGGVPSAQDVSDGICTVEVKPDSPLAAMIAKAAVEPATVEASQPTASVAPTAEANRERVLDHYAAHGGSIAELIEQTGVRSTSIFMSTARKAGDPRIAAGDAKRHPMPAAAARAIERQKAKAADLPKTQPSATPPKARVPQPPPEPTIAPLPDGRKRTQAEMIEAARLAVPAPSFGQRKGVSCRTG